MEEVEKAEQEEGLVEEEEEDEDLSSSEEETSSCRTCSIAVFAIVFFDLPSTIAISTPTQTQTYSNLFGLGTPFDNIRDFEESPARK